MSAVFLPAHPEQVLEYVPDWLHLCIACGGFRDCILLSDLYLSQQRQEPAITFSALLFKAKALRNLGDFDGALASYRLAIREATRQRRPAETSICLLLIGKLYGNYRGQKSLFSAFVQEAKLRLERDLVDDASEGHARLIRYLAICEDALGQAYRDSQEGMAEAHFNRSIELNKEIVSNPPMPGPLVELERRPHRRTVRSPIQT